MMVLILSLTDGSLYSQSTLTDHSSNCHSSKAVKCTVDAVKMIKCLRQVFKVDSCRSRDLTTLRHEMCYILTNRWAQF